MPDINPSRHQRTTISAVDPNVEIVITDDGSKTLRVKETGVTWHSESGALAESKTVFLDNSKVADRLNATLPVAVLEIGFGTGLNFWITASKAIKQSALLNYVAIEPNLLSEKLIAMLEHCKLPECLPAAHFFVEQIFKDRKPHIFAQQIDLQIVDSIVSLTDNQDSFDCVYHDPFAPDVANDLWSPEYFDTLFDLLKPAGRLVTYCVKSRIQKILKQVGFVVSKTPGPIGGKREVLVAQKP